MKRLLDVGGHSRSTARDRRRQAYAAACMPRQAAGPIVPCRRAAGQYRHAEG